MRERVVVVDWRREARERKEGSGGQFPLTEKICQYVCGKSHARQNCRSQKKRKERQQREKEFSRNRQSFQSNWFPISPGIGMGLEKHVAEVFNKKDHAHRMRTLCVHAFSDLSHISPVVFLYLLKECYIYGTCKATAKFRALQHQVHLVLHNDPKPGPATFVIHCLYLLPLFGEHNEGLSHLVSSALQRFLKRQITSEDSQEVKDLAARLFLDIVGGQVYHDEKIAVKVLEIFDVRLTNIENAMCQMKAKDKSSLGTAKEFIEKYILKLVETQSYVTAVSLLERFSLHQFEESFLLSMLQSNQFKAAEKWATFMGKPMLCILAQEYTERNMLKAAYEIIRKNNLRQDFPDVYQKCKESSLKKLAEKGCWDVAEAKTNSDKHLIEYLVYLAMEADYTEKVDELCDRYSLDRFLDIKVPETSIQPGRHLCLDEFSVEDIIWVDEVEGLLGATCYIEECKVIGVDCEWKPNYTKGSKPNKVSIMQIASEKAVFIFDLIKLHGEVPDILDNCLTRILQSPKILKLGYNFQSDIKQLSHSYGELKCFKYCEMFLDIQNFSKEPRGGLSGLAEKILGAGLNKTRRNSNWEQRPLTENQLEYAALDAVVLIHIFCHIRGQCQPSEAEKHEKLEWKSYIVAHMDNIKKPKKNTKNLKRA